MRLPLRYRRWLLCCLVLLVPGLAYPAWRHFYPVMSAPDWQYRVVQTDIARVSALALDTQGRLYISQEFANGEGTILKQNSDGSLETVLHGLSKPDGLASYGDGVAVSQESGQLPLLLLQGDKVEPLFASDNVEGIASDGHYLYFIEDKQRGRLRRYDPSTAQVVTLREGLEEGEGVTVCADGRLFYTEKKKGWVKQWQASGEDTLVQAGLNQPGFLLCSADGLWISEDSTHMARLLLLDPSGQLQVILQHLRSAQTLIAVAPGRYLLAEQGRKRILEFKRRSHGI
jgi:DNA-binding beta-propeller fold protein YncE